MDDFSSAKAFISAYTLHFWSYLVVVVVPTANFFAMLLELLQLVASFKAS